MARTALRAKGGCHVSLDAKTEVMILQRYSFHSLSLQAPSSQHSHHKSQTFTVQKGYAVEQPCIVADTGLSQSLSQEAHDDTTTSGQHESVQHAASMSRTPKWIENDGKAGPTYTLMYA